MIYNGLIVTAQRRVEIVSESAYRGFSYGLPWPLSQVHGSAEAIDLSMLIARGISQVSPGLIPDGDYPFAVLSEVDLVRKYVAACTYHGITVRVLLCATNRAFPSMDHRITKDLLARAKHIGFDYGYSSCDYSAIYDDFYPPTPISLLPFASRLNGFGLFNTISDLNSYIAERWSIIHGSEVHNADHEGYPLRTTTLEDTGDFVAVDVWELEIPAIIGSTELTTSLCDENVRSGE